MASVFEDHQRFLTVRVFAQHRVQQGPYREQQMLVRIVRGLVEALGQPIGAHGGVVQGTGVTPPRRCPVREYAGLPGDFPALAQPALENRLRIPRRRIHHGEPMQCVVQVAQQPFIAAHLIRALE